MSIKLSEFRYTRHLARVYRASVRRQDLSPQSWRDAGIEETGRQLVAAMNEWHRRKQIAVYDRAVSPDWDWK